MTTNPPTTDAALLLAVDRVLSAARVMKDARNRQGPREYQERRSEMDAWIKGRYSAGKEIWADLQLLKNALTLHEEKPKPALTVSVEEIARIVDPDEWANHDRVKPNADKMPPEHSVIVLSELTKRSRLKAQAIFALSNPDSGDAGVSACCEGEICSCGQPATAKVEETIFHDDYSMSDHKSVNPNAPFKRRHPLTAYVCAEHFAQIMWRNGKCLSRPTEAEPVDGEGKA